MIHLIRNLTCLAMLIVLPAACSSRNAAPVDAAPPDRPVVSPDVGLDSCCLADGPAADVPRVDLLPPDLPQPDLRRPDLLLPDLGGKKKLIAWALCSNDTKCKPYCGVIGSNSEGWYDGCAKTLLKDPLTGGPYWDLCGSCVVICDAIGSWSEGWYAQCP